MPTNNSIVVTGDDNALERVATLVAKVDVEVEGAGNAPQIIHLEKAIASDIQPKLAEIFIEGAPRQGGRGPAGGQITPVIVADDAANMLIVRASPADFSLIKNLTATLDQEETDATGGFELVQVASAFRVADIAATIQNTVEQAAFKASDARPRRDGRPAGPEFLVEPVEASNTLILAGDRKQIQVAKAMIEQMQAMGPAGGKVTKIIPLGANRDPEEIKRVIEEMINDNKSQGTSGSRPRGRPR
jgi:type II secretory pathway component GspD/PulD (secretin)